MPAGGAGGGQASGEGDPGGDTTTPDPGSDETDQSGAAPGQSDPTPDQSDPTPEQGGPTSDQGGSATDESANLTSDQAPESVANQQNQATGDSSIQTGESVVPSPVQTDQASVPATGQSESDTTTPSSTPLNEVAQQPADNGNSTSNIYNFDPPRGNAPIKRKLQWPRRAYPPNLTLHTQPLTYPAPQSSNSPQQGFTPAPSDGYPSQSQYISQPVPYSQENVASTFQGIAPVVQDSGAALQQGYQFGAGTDMYQ